MLREGEDLIKEIRSWEEIQNFIPTLCLSVGGMS